jgi:hypothetical protein
MSITTNSRGNVQSVEKMILIYTIQRLSPSIILRERVEEASSFTAERRGQQRAKKKDPRTLGR